MLHQRFIIRQIMSSPKQTVVFIVCVALSIITLVSLGGFGDSVNESLLRDARTLLAGDIVVESGFPYLEPLDEELTALDQQDGIDVSRTYEFISVVRHTTAEETVVAEMKVVEPGYPFYGEVFLESGNAFGETLKSGEIIVEQALLDRLGLSLGDDLIVGSTTLTIVDISLSEPDEPIDFFNIGPRVFVAAADLEAIDLVKPGSLVNFKTLIQVEDATTLDSIADQLNGVAKVGQERVDTYRTNQSAVQAFFDDFLTFLSLIGIFTLMLAGIGIQSSLAAFLKEREDTIAILRTFGATSGFISRQFFTVAAVLGAVGTAIGIAVGFVLQLAFPLLFANFLPDRVEFVLSPRALAEGILLGIFVVFAFTFIPLYQLKELKPSFIFRRETKPLQRSPLFYLILSSIFVFFAGMVFWYLRNPERTAYFAAGVVGLVAITFLLTRSVLFVLRRQRPKPLASRQALRGLFRPRNATAAIIVTLSTSLAVLFTIYLLEQNLRVSFVEAYPDDAPNLFLIDIQPEQREGLTEIIGEEVEYFPLVLGRIASINGEEIERRTLEEREAQAAGPGPPDGGQQLDSTFSLTYREEIRPNETLLAGPSLYDPTISGPQVSISSDMLELYDFSVGDTIEFDIQGVSLNATISSIREFEFEEGDFAPPFDFVMPEADLGAAPQSIVTTLFWPAEEVATLQNELAAAYPNITLIDVSSAIGTLSELVGNLTIIIRFFMLFSLVAGFLIIVSAVLATRFARIQEAVYYKVLGAKQRFVLRVFTLENVFLGSVSAVLALFMSQLAGYLIVTQAFELEYQPFLLPSIALLAATVVLVTLVGLFASSSILRHKPIVFLREQTAE